MVSLLMENTQYQVGERARSLIVTILLTSLIMAIYEAVYFFVLLKKSVREEEQFKQAIIQVELDTLRNQIQPHFFFNTLNTLRDIIDQNPKEDARQFVDTIKHNIISRSKPLEINIKATNDFIKVTNKIQKKSTQLPSAKTRVKKY